MCANPLAWKKTHEGQFMNVDFHTKQVLGIPWLQIETERMFNLNSFNPTGVLKALRRCYIQVQNLD
jgi:hypothetical protein